MTLIGKTEPPVYWIVLPLWDELFGGCVPTPVPVLLIHEFFLVLVSLSASVDAWLGFQDDTAPLLQDLDAWTHRVGYADRAPVAALTPWGDSAPYHAGWDSLILLLWTCISGSRRDRYWNLRP